MGLIIRSRTVGCPTEYDIRTSKTEYNTCAWRIVFIHPSSLQAKLSFGPSGGGKAEKERSLGREGRSNDPPPISITLPSSDPPTAPPTVKFPSFLFSLHLSPPPPCVSLWIVSVPCIYFTSKFRIFSRFYMLLLN